MSPADLAAHIQELLNLGRETEWVEFKKNNSNPETIGENLSAIANGAALHGKDVGYIVWGIDDLTRNVVGTSFAPRNAKKGNEELENWLLRSLSPQVEFTIHEFESEGKRIVMFSVPAAHSSPVQFYGCAYIRVGSYTKKLAEYPEKERRLWQVLSRDPEDWSAGVVEGASLADLDEEAISFARRQYSEKHPGQAAEQAQWDDATFLNKCKLCIKGHLTRSTIILLGTPAAAHLLSPAQARITWILRDASNEDKDYVHFDPPFILASDKILAKIRNLTVRQLPSGTLFPHELKQYDPWVIRETLHNCIAHQDYTRGGRINVIEMPNALLFTNLGSFIPGTVEDMIRSDAPPEVYRNPFLAQAMVNLNMIDTIGSGIKRMFRVQKERSFPMPDYNVSSPTKVEVRLAGQVLDENYTQLLLSRTDLDLMDVIALDKVQKKKSIDDYSFKRLKARKLIEGRRLKLFVSANIAAVTGDKAAYIKNRAFDKSHYRGLVIEFLKSFHEASRKELDSLLVSKLSDAMNDKQKGAFITNLLQEMKAAGEIEPVGKTRWAKWRLSKIEE